ncbi:MAG TPA: phage integrase SAM-like domain-containing protein [Cytophagaceae bacterium]
MATVKAIIRKSKGHPLVNESGHTLIYIQYGHQSKITLFSTGIKISPIHWNEKKQLIDSTKGVKKIVANEELIKTLEKEDNYTNANINAFKSKVNTIVRTLQHRDIEPTVENVKQEFNRVYSDKKEVTFDFFDLFEEFINNPGNKTETTIKGYRSCLNNLKKFQEVKKEKITLEKIDLKFYDKFISYLLNEHELPDKSVGMAQDTVGTQIKNLKAFLNHLIKRGVKIEADLREFKVFKGKPVIIYLTQEELEQLYLFDISHNERLQKVKDLFILGCSTGLRISDLSRLGKEHIQGAVIKMKAHKTGKNVIVPLIYKSDEILKKYEYQLPSISDQKFNDYVKELCELANINAPVEMMEFKGGKKIYKTIPKYQLISSHSAVKTFITHCGEKGISAKVVAEITGKTVKVILDHYYGTSEKVIQMEMQRAFGEPGSNLKVV